MTVEGLRIYAAASPTTGEVFTLKLFQRILIKKVFPIEKLIIILLIYFSLLFMLFLSKIKLSLFFFLLFSSKAFCVLRLEGISPEDQRKAAESYPAVVSLRAFDENEEPLWSGTASIVRLGEGNHVLTSAHLLEDPQVKLIQIHTKEEIYRFKKEDGAMVWHPNFPSGGRAYDVALIRVGVGDCRPCVGTKWLSEQPAFEVCSISYEEKESYDVRGIGYGDQGVINAALSEVVLDEPPLYGRMAADFSARWGKREKHLGVLKSKKSFPFSHIKGRLAYGDSGGAWLLINPSELSDPCKINDKIIGVHVASSTLVENSRRNLSCKNQCPYRNLGTPITPSLKEWLDKMAKAPFGPKKPPRLQGEKITSS